MPAKYARVLVLLVLAASLAACDFVATPGAGEEAVLVKKPWFFGHGGVDEESVKTGRAYIAPSTDAIYVNMQPQRFDEDFVDLMSADGVPLDFHSAIRLQVTDSVRLIESFGEDWYKNNVQPEFWNQVRQAVRKHGMNETAVSAVAIDQIDRELNAGMLRFITERKLPVKLIQVTVGRANPPDALKDQRVATAIQDQRLNTEKLRKLAEDQRAAAEQSRANADNAYRVQLGLSPEQFVQLEAIKMQQEVCASGKTACTFFVGAGATPVLPLR